ncbi:unnamed protein product [Linum tenue]|uniref:Uncharacterized protein n=1 Tax=Linum tenue TaxID=586396 RepID=A0AAV0MPZ8_9ROSI|nr:unnamed protein product [Linum tenue]
MGDGGYRHVYRSANAATHIMAHMKTRWNETEIWFDRPPMSVIDQLELDSVMASHS